MAVWTDADEDQCGRPAAAGGGVAGEVDAEDENDDDDDDEEGEEDDLTADFDCGEDAASSNWTSPDEALPLLKEANGCGMMGFFKQVNHTFYFTNSEL